MSGGQVPDPDDISFRGKPDFLPEGSAEVVVHIDDTDEQLTH